MNPFIGYRVTSEYGNRMHPIHHVVLIHGVLT